MYIMSLCTISTVGFMVEHDPPVAPTDSLLHHLKFLTGDLTGSTIINYGSGPNATSNGTNIVSSGVCTLQGTSAGYITLGGTYTASASTAFTISFYLKSNKTGTTNENLFISTWSSYNEGFLFEAYPTGNLYVQVKPMDTTQNWKTNNVWTHYALVYTLTATQTQFTLYINGVNKGASTAGVQSYTKARTSYIGHATWDTNQFIIGQLRNFRWYTRALTSNEVSTLVSVD